MEREERTRAWLNVVQTNRVVSDALEEAVEAAAGLSLAEFELLVRISNAEDGRLRMVDLADLLLVSKSGVTKLVDRVEGAGLVARESSAEDRRLTFARITKDGRRALGRAAPAFEEAHERVFSQHLSDQDVRCLRGALHKVLEGNGAWEERRCSPELADRQTAPEPS
jgi:DNA-binding MarR family transcriptional regulator